MHNDGWETSPTFQVWQAEYKKAQLLADGAVKEALLKKLMEPAIGLKAITQQVFVGKEENKTAMVTLAYRLGSSLL